MGQTEIIPALRDSIFEDLPSVDDEKILRIIRLTMDHYLEGKSMIEFGDVDQQGRPINLSELNEIADDVEAGQGIPLEAVLEKNAAWLKSLK